MKLLVAAAIFGFALSQPVAAAELTFASKGDAVSLDPYAINEAFTIGFLGNVYESLIRRNEKMEIQPALAKSWELLEPTRWRFHLRRGVTFHEGQSFTADDVIFSFERARKEGSDMAGRLSTVAEAIKIDDFTVDFVTHAPNPILTSEWDGWLIMSKSWAEENGAADPQNMAEGTENYATSHANGTGPFRIVRREPDVITVAEANPDWWDTPQHNLSMVTLRPISSDATRVAALMTGEVEMIYDVPVQDIDRVNDAAGYSVIMGPELRTIYFSMDQERDELLYSNVRGKNPFKDVRVRRAIYHAIDATAIRDKIMRGLSTPSAMMVAPQVNGGGNVRFERLRYDPETAKKLLTEAGYPDGFEVNLDCSNDRYVNDAAICTAVVSMLARIGITVNLNAMPKSQYFAKVLARDVSFFMLGWTPSSVDSWNVLHNLHGCFDAETGRGKFNFSRYCNPEVDALAAQILSETDQEARAKLVEQAWAMTTDEIADIPLHQQGLAWGVADSVDVKQRPDNVFLWYRVNKN